MACDSFEVHSVHSQRTPSHQNSQCAVHSDWAIFQFPSAGDWETIHLQGTAEMETELPWPQRRAASVRAGWLHFHSYREPYFETCQATGRSSWAAFEDLCCGGWERTSLAFISIPARRLTVRSFPSY